MNKTLSERMAGTRIVADPTPTSRGWNAAIDAYLPEVRALEQQAPKWVSVRARLPEVGISVLLFRGRDGCVRMGRFSATHAWLIIGEGVEPSRFGVTHWMPLPSPPSEGGA